MNSKITEDRVGFKVSKPGTETGSGQFLLNLDNFSECFLQDSVSVVRLRIQMLCWFCLFFYNISTMKEETTVAWMLDMSSQ